MNNTINNTAGDIMTGVISQFVPESIAPYVNYILLSALLFVAILFMIKWFTETSLGVAIVLSSLPAILLDVTQSFGQYTFLFPFDYTYTVDKGVLTLGIVDWILNFGIFKTFGLWTFDSVSGIYTLSGLQWIPVILLTIGDSIIEFIVLSYIFYYLTDRQLSVSVILAAFAVLVYGIVTNTFAEFATMTENAQHFFYFIDAATTTQLLIVLGSAVISFAIIVFLLSTLISLFTGAGKSTIAPGWETSGWQKSFTGVAFGLAFAYSVLVILHPSYSWYIVLPILIAYGVLRGSLKGHVNGIRAHQDQVSAVREAINEEMGRK